MKFASPASNNVEFSIIAGRVSTEDSDRIIETLEALRNQDGQPCYEILLVDRLGDNISERIQNEYPDVKLIRCEPQLDLPTMRTIALKQSIGQIVAVTEDHCVPATDWLEKLRDIFNENQSTNIVGGCVINGVDESGLDWATFLCEYSAFMPPVAEGLTDNLPGMNVAYRRSIFDSVPEEVLTRGFWETTLHPRLVSEGQQFVSANTVRMFHCKKFSFGLFLRQRFIYSRYFAGIRFKQGNLGRRLVATAACLILPALLLFRFLRSIRQRNHIGKTVLAALPYLLAFYFVWAVGEAVGYLFGPADALSRIE